ncbi:uncharacterized protein MYCGRDRAFT_33937 [Zymoseptoria tritici IPO323]|uniref:RNA helicase n=1 Tax=Zymoseptoria tritici (strain CBS 115943 / IPO323) TaxID=336722 RepID=F9WY46_ZYMTI|nr:uncharacterized protein MYCGRDRAFT_33937 [Zymoseptoria tritici IPO323]EGP92252.1 hypothetical protein MYCGRDRAFT_33937 [Zymoseptoria tritici IPO323]
MGRSPNGYRRDEDRRRDGRSHRRSPSRDVRAHSPNSYRTDFDHNQRREDRDGRGARRDRSRDRDSGRGEDRGDSRYHDRPKERHRDSDRDRYDSRRGERRSRDYSPKMAAVKAEEEKRTAAEKALQEERRAKLEAWKKDVLAKKMAKATSDAGGSSIPASPAPDSPAPSNPATVEEAPPAPVPQLEAKPRLKFDPKEIKRRTEVKMAKMRGDASTLDAGAVPAMKNGAASMGRIPDQPVKGNQHPPSAKSGALVGDVKMSGFGLNKGAAEKTAAAMRNATTFDDEEEDHRKLKKLSQLPEVESAGDAMYANDDENDQDEQTAISGDLSEEAEAKAARKAARRRAKQAQKEQNDITMGNTEDTATTVAVTVARDSQADKMDEDEEMDPLEAFMSNLDQVEAPREIKGGKRVNQEFSLDDGPDFDAVGDDTEDLLLNPRHKRKEVPNTDHSKVNYEEIRKKFYAESAEIADMTTEDVEKMRAELDNITVHGVDIPKPITKWSQCGFPAQVIEVINEQKFENPTAIQSQALPALMSGRDTIGIAKTGSGKTLAFILPMFRHIKDQRPVANLEGPIGLIMAPTRELAVQIHRECKPYLKALGLRGVCAYGGAPIKEQIGELKRGAEVIVCTPGRMIDLLAANSGRVTNLRRVSYVVLDEADRMFDMGFEPQITKMLGNIRPDRQTVLFSATFPKKMESLARKALTKPVEILVGGRSVVAPEITQMIEVRPEETKFVRTLQLLGDLIEGDEEARSLIFVERQETADLIFKQLGKKGYPSVSVHGGREQIDRDQAIIDFKAGIFPIMVATSVAARGLDVKQLKLVINYDCPNHGEDYVHRAGRTGRAGNTGTAVTFVTPAQERYAGFLVRALEDSKQEVPDELREMAKVYKEKVASGEASFHSSGFGGHGVERYDAARAAERAREKKIYKTGDEPEDEEDVKDKKSKESEVDKLLAKAAGGVKATDMAAAEEPTAPPAGVASLRSDLAAHLDRAMKVEKVEAAPASSTSAINDPLAKAAAAAASINNRLGTKGTRPGAPPENRGPDAGAFHATLEINDFPQKARWAVTNRSNVAKILEATGTSITTKGSYQDPSKPVPEGQSKLFILVEGDTEIVVSSAMKMLTEKLREGMLIAQENEARGGGGGGRYRVV